MKRLLYSLCIVISTLAVPVSCNDDNGTSPTRELLLTEVTKNGVTRVKLFYDIKRVLARTDTYSNGDLFQYTLYEYNEHEIEEARRYNANDHSLQLKVVFTHDNIGRVSKIKYYTASSDFEDVAAFHNYSYNLSGQLKDRTFYTLPGNVLEYREEFTYDAAGHRIQKKRVMDPGQPKEYSSFETVYTPGDKTIPEYWIDTVFLLSVTDLDENIWEMFNISWHRKTWESFGVEDGESRTTTERVFEDGYLKRQILTTVFPSIPSADKNVTEVTYEYTE